MHAQGPPKAREACTAWAGLRLTLTGVAPPYPNQVWQLARAVEGDTRGIRGTAENDIPEEHREIVADYYRRLGQAEED